MSGQKEQTTLEEGVEKERLSVTLDLVQAAERARCHPDTLRKMMKAGEAPGRKRGRSWVVSEEAFQEWINERCRSPKAQAPQSGGAAVAASLASQRAQQIKNKPKPATLAAGLPHEEERATYNIKVRR